MAQIEKLKTVLSSYYKTKTTKSPSTPIVLVHEINLVNDKEDKENKETSMYLNKQIGDLKSLLKSQQQKTDCKPYLAKIKGQLVFDKNCDKKKRRRSKISKLKKYLKIIK